MWPSPFQFTVRSRAHWAQGNWSTIAEVLQVVPSRTHWVHTAQWSLAKSEHSRVKTVQGAYFASRAHQAPHEFYLSALEIHSCEMLEIHTWELDEIHTWDFNMCSIWYTAVFHDVYYNHQCTAEFPYVCLHVMCAQKKCICYPFFCVLIVTPENPLNCAFEWGQISSLVYCKCALLYTTCAVTWMSLLFTQDVQWHYQKCASYTKLVQSHAPHNTTWNSVTLHSLNSITAPAI